MYGASNMETYLTICKIDSQWEFAVCLRKIKQGLYIKRAGIYIYIYLWLIHDKV